MNKKAVYESITNIDSKRCITSEGKRKIKNISTEEKLVAPATGINIAELRTRHDKQNAVQNLINGLYIKN